MTEIPSGAATSLCMATADKVEVRGLDLARDLMGNVTFTEYFYLLLTGDKPTSDQKFFLDLLLVAIAEHGLMPTVQAARMTLAADPGSLQGALAAGILGAGPVLLGTAERCGELLAGAARRVDAGENGASVVEAMTRDTQQAGGRMPGFGHPVHKPVDPRAERILELAEARGIAGRHIALARQFHAAVARTWGKPLVMNVSMPIAATLLDLDFSPAAIKTVPLLARTASILAHLMEEKARPIGFHKATAAERSVAFARKG
jgi:citrate synthase